MASAVDFSDLASDSARSTITGQSEGSLKYAQVEDEKKYPYAEKMGLRPREGRFFANYPLTGGYVVDPGDKLTAKVSKWSLGFFSALTLGSLPAILLMNDLFILKMRKGRLTFPPIDQRPRFRQQVIYRQVCAVADFFWGARTHKNVIISLFEKGKLKSLEEIHTFLIGEVVKMHVKEGVSKQKIVKTLNLSFTKQKHPMAYFFDIEDIIVKYEAGLSSQSIFSELSKEFDSESLKSKLVMRILVNLKGMRSTGVFMRREAETPLDANFIGRFFFWGGVGEMIMKRCLKNFLREDEEKLFLDEILSRLSNGESREEISKDLGLPSPSYIYGLAGHSLGVAGPFVVFSNEDWKLLNAMIRKSASEKLAPRFQFSEQKVDGELFPSK